MSDTDDAGLAAVAARAGLTCLAGVTLTLVALRLLLHFSWWWCAAPVLVALTCSTLFVIVSAFTGRRIRRRHR